jgi:hypothetical protein
LSVGGAGRAIGRTALSRTADAAAVVVRQMEFGFRFMILTFLARRIRLDLHDVPGDGLRPPQMRHSERGICGTRLDGWQTGRWWTTARFSAGSGRPTERSCFHSVIRNASAKADTGAAQPIAATPEAHGDHQ